MKTIEIFKRACRIETVCLISFVAFFHCVNQEGKIQSDLIEPSCNRIISFAPSITETLFALGQGSRVVGVTRYCNYPPETRAIPRVGGYTDPNFEMILGLRPDLVLLLNDHGPLLDFLKKKKIGYCIIKNETLDELLGSFSKIASLCRIKEKGDSMADTIRAELSERDHDTVQSPSVLFCIGREDPGSGRISKVYAAGAGTFYHELLLASGARNACGDKKLIYPELSTEGIVRMGPEVIIDCMPSITPALSDKVVLDWNSLPLLPAVRLHNVYSLAGDYATIPGPRVVLLLREIRRIIHEVKGKSEKHS